MSPYWWYIVTYDLDNYPVEISVTVAAMNDGDAAIAADNILADMGICRQVRGQYLVERQDRVEVEGGGEE